jgi:hypothetical protein
LGQCSPPLSSIYSLSTTSTSQIFTAKSAKPRQGTAYERLTHPRHARADRSVAWAVYQDPGDGFVEVGNVTIPPNFDIPPAGSLVDVRYLYARLGGSLYQPVYLGPRTDVDVADSAKSLKFKQGEDEES